MNNEQAPLFYAEFAALLAKYECGGIAGIWFSGNSDNYGFIKGVSPNEPELIPVIEHINERLRQWANEAHKGPLEFYAEAYGIKIKKK